LPFWTDLLKIEESPDSRSCARIGSAETAAALKRGEAVEFPFGRLKRVKRVSKRWQYMHDEHCNSKRGVGAGTRQEIRS